MSDELNCEVNCDETEFKCEKDRACIKKDYVCDNDPDCLDYSDEKNCSCKGNEFQCGGQYQICILNDLLCDGIVDCPDGSDEEDSLCLSRSCSGNARKCLNGKCVSSYQLCGKNPACEHDHKALRCNYYGENNNEICKFGTCEQICVENYNNDTQKYHCKCANGYEKNEYSDSLKKSECLPISDFKSIFTASGSKLGILIDYQHSPIHSFIQTASAKISNFDYFLKDDDLTLFWIETKPISKMYRLNINIKTDIGVIKHTGYNATNSKLIKQPKTPTLINLAVDWINSKIYTIDNYMINVLNFNGTNEKSLLYAGMYPIEITLDLNSKQIIWSSYLRSISIASMDGENSRRLITEDIELATGLFIDYSSQRLWWCDSRKSTIETALLDGSDRHVVKKFDIQNSNGIRINPRRFDMFSSELYVVLSNRSIIMMTKNGTNLVNEVLIKGPFTHKASSIKVIHSVAKQFYENPCEVHKCHESTVCLLSAVNSLQRTCSCPNHLFIQKNGSHVQCVERHQIPSLCTKKCFNSGKCKFVNKKETCVCSLKYSGEYCENFICSEYCVHGVCILPPENIMDSLTREEVLRSRKCKCKEQWTGERCTVPVKPCQVRLQVFLI